MRKPSLSRARGFRPPQALERQGPAPQQTLVARAQAEARVGCGQGVLVIGKTAVRSRKVSPSVRVDRRGSDDPLVRLGGLLPLPHARVRVAPHPIEHRVRSDEGFGPSGKGNGFIRSRLK
jgi:hypothetical protein